MYQYRYQYAREEDARKSSRSLYVVYPRHRLAPLRFCDFFPPPVSSGPMPMMASASDLCCACNSAQNAKGSSFAVASAVAVAVVAGTTFVAASSSAKVIGADVDGFALGGGTTFCVFFTAGGMDTAGAGDRAGGGGGAPPASAVQNAAGSFSEGGGFAGGAAMGGVAGAFAPPFAPPFARDSFLLSLFPAGFGAASLGAGMPAMRRSRSSRDMVVAETDWGRRGGRSRRRLRCPGDP